MILLLLAQGAVAPPPPPARPNADFVCRVLDTEQQILVLRGRVRQAPAGRVVVDVTSQDPALPKVTGYSGPIYGDLFDARVLGGVTEFHYNFQLPQTYGRNGTVRVLQIDKPTADRPPGTTWVAAGLCDFTMVPSL